MLWHLSRYLDRASKNCFWCREAGITIFVLYSVPWRPLQEMAVSNSRLMPVRHWECGLCSYSTPSGRTGKKLLSNVIIKKSCAATGQLLHFILGHYDSSVCATDHASFFAVTRRKLNFVTHLEQLGFAQNLWNWQVSIAKSMTML